MGHYTSAQQWRVFDFDDDGNIVTQIQPLPGRVLMSARIAGKPFVKNDLELGATLWNPLGFGKSFREHPTGQVLGPRFYGTASVTF